MVARLTLLLPPRERLRLERALPTRLAQLLGRSDRQPDVAGGYEAQLLRQFDVLPRRIAVAPLTRQRDAGDAAYGVWLRADPAYVRADMACVRMLACGELGLTADEAESLLSALRPLFGDEGFPISAPLPSRWYLAIPAQSRLPPFAAPELALGDDLHVHMPAGDDGRRWRRLLNEAQVILHNHPVNAQRAAVGKLPVNSVWFWGAGALPDHVRAPGLRVASEDAVIQGLCRQAGITPLPPTPATLASGTGTLAFDLRDLRQAEVLDSTWLEPAMSALVAGRFQSLRMDFADGALWDWRHAHRWRFWRRPASGLQ